MIDDDTLDARLREADPGRAAYAVPGVALDSAMRRAVEHRSRRRPSWGVFAALVAALVLPAVAVPAVAQLRDFEAQTGESCAGTECGSPDDPTDDEFIRTGASDFDEWLQLQAPEHLNLPVSVPRGDIDARVRAIFADVDGAIVAGDPASQYARLELCAWIDEWVRADDAADLEARDVASVQIEVEASRRIWADNDGGGVVPWLQRHARSAREGDRDGMQVAAWQQACGSWDGVERAGWAELNSPRAGSRAGGGG